MLWKIFYIMQCAEIDGLEKLSYSLSAEDCVQGLRGEMPSTSDARKSQEKSLEQWLATFLRVKRQRQLRLPIWSRSPGCGLLV